jgi:integrase
MTEYVGRRFGSQPEVDRYIFEAPDGERYSRVSVRSTIINIFKSAGIPTNTTEHHARLHDIRHLFALKAMEKMKLEGLDLYCAMPLLSIYLGHEGLRETEKYLWLPNFRMEEISASGQKLLPGMIPEVVWDEN